MQAPLDRREEREGGDGPVADPSGSRASSRMPITCGNVRTTASSRTLTIARGGRDAVAQHGLEPERPSVDREAVEHVPRARSGSAPASTRLPSAMSPAMPEKQ